MKHTTVTKTQVVILAAGRGERLRPLTDTTPKPLLEVSGTPIIMRTLEAASDVASEFIIVVGYLGEQLRQRLGEAYNRIPIRYVGQQERNGTAGALACARPLLGDHFVVLSGDDLYAKKDINELSQCHWAFLVSEVPDPKNVGIVVLDGSGLLENIIESPHDSRTNLVNCGAYALRREFFTYAAAAKSEISKELGLPQTLMKVAKSGISVHAIRATFWFPIGYPEDLEKAQHLALG